MSLSQSSSSSKRQKHNSNFFRQKADFCLNNGKVHGLLASAVAGSRCLFFPRNLPLLSSQLLFLSLALILGYGLPSWWKDSHQQLQAYPTCNLGPLLPSFSCRNPEPSSYFPFLNQSLWPEGGVSCWLASPELHILPRGLMVGSASLKPQALREEQFPQRSVLRRGMNWCWMSQNPRVP